MTFAQRARRALGQLLLALINATLILVIVAAIAVSTMIGAIQELADQGISEVTEKVLEAANIDTERFSKRIGDIQSELQGIRVAIEERRAAGQMDEKLAQVEKDLNVLSEQLNKFSEIQITIDPETLEEIEEVLTNTFNEIVGRKMQLRNPAPTER